MKVFICLTGFLFCQSLIIAQAPDYTKDTYKPLSGKVLGADATLYLHIGNGGISGYLILLRDPKPFAIGEHFNGHRQKDSLFLTAIRSPGISIQLKLRWQKDSITGYAEMLADPSLTGNQQSLRKGSASLSIPSEQTLFTFSSLRKDEVLPMKLPNNPVFHYLSGTVWPPAKVSNAWTKSMEIQIMDWMGQKTAPANSDAILAAHASRYIAPWKKDLQGVPEAELKSWGPSMLEREYSDQIEVMYESKFFLVLARRTYAYNGGAHGNYQNQLITIDKRNGKTLKVADVLTQQGMAQLPKLLEAAFRQQFGMDAKKTLEQNGALVKAMPLNDNFYMTDAGIGFWYSPYEVMPFVYSDIMVVVPLAAVQSLISPGFLGAGR